MSVDPGNLATLFRQRNEKKTVNNKSVKLAVCEMICVGVWVCVAQWQPPMTKLGKEKPSKAQERPLKSIFFHKKTFKSSLSLETSNDTNRYNHSLNII